MSQKYERFVAALEALCREHSVVLSTTMYDGMQVWDASEDDIGSPVHSAGIEDRTEEKKT